MMQVVSGPAMAVAPGLTRLAETLSAPGFAQLPAQLSQFTDVMTELSKRLGPLTPFAESAGGLFGGLRLPGMSSPAARPAPSTPGGHDVVMQERTVTHESSPPSKQAAPSSKRAAAKRAPAKKSAAKKSAATR